MAAALNNLPSTSNAFLLRELEIKRVTKINELHQFADVVASVFEPPDSHVMMFYEQASNLLTANHTSLHLYIAYLKGEPVSTSALFLGHDVAGVYSVATVKHVRKKGFGTAVTLAALPDAHDQGYQIATLQASEDAQNLYAKIGFKVCCEFYIYQ